MRHNLATWSAVKAVVLFCAVLGIAAALTQVVAVRREASSFRADIQLGQHGATVTVTPVSSPTARPVATVTATPKNPFPTVTERPEGEFGTWVWTSPDALSPAQMKGIVDSAARHHFTAIYITIDSYLEISRLPAGVEREQKIAAYSSALARFVALASARGISVDAEAGWRDWALPSKRHMSFAIIDYVQSYNAAHPQARLRGLQFDVEPYLLPEFETKKAEVLADFVRWADAVVTRSEQANFELSFVIPHFYDSLQRWTPIIEIDGYATYAFNHLLNSLNRLERSTIIIMAYRNFAHGEDGSIELAKQEMIDVSAGYSTRIIVAQEVGDVEPGYVTFYSMSMAQLSAELGEIRDAFKGYAAFSGMAVHYLDPFLALSE